MIPCIVTTHETGGRIAHLATASQPPVSRCGAPWRANGLRAYYAVASSQEALAEALRREQCTPCPLCWTEAGMDLGERGDR